MGSTFGSYHVAYSGMYVSQAGLAATSTNLANVNTTGASRVRVAISDTSQTLSNTATLSSGASVSSITRARDIFLDQTYRTLNADASYLAVKSGNLEYMQEIMGEFETDSSDDGASELGVQKLMENYFTSWEELAKDPDNDANRQAVLEAAASLISGLAEIDEQLQELQQDAVNGVKDGVDTLNDLADQVAELNKTIAQADASGGEASYLRDQRDALLDQMSALANISVTETNGVLKVMIGGVALVNGDKTHQLTVEGDGSANNPISVKWVDFDCEAEITSGSIKAYMEEADQSGYEAITDTDTYDFAAGATSSISNLRQALNDLLTTLAAATNSLHSTGYGLDGSTGLAFFTAIDASQPLSISNIQVNPELVSDTDKLAAASTAGDNNGDNNIANEIVDLNTQKIYRFNGISLDIDNFYEALISWIGTAGDDAASSYDTKNALVQQVDNQRLSISSISLDEEMSKMIVYQNAYAASARVLSTIDALIADLIEDLG